MNKERISYLLVIIFLLLVILIQRECKKPDPADPGEKTHFVTEYVFDSVPQIVNNYIPKIIEVWRIDTVPADIDTLQILKDYFAKVYYCDTIIDDTSALIIIRDSITQNKIYSRSGTYINRRPTQIITTITPEIRPTWNIGAGFFVGGNLNEFQAGPTIIITTNKKGSYTAGYDIVNKTGRIGYYWHFR